MSATILITTIKNKIFNNCIFINLSSSSSPFYFLSHKSVSLSPKPHLNQTLQRERDLLLLLLSHVVIFFFSLRSHVGHHQRRARRRLRPGERLRLRVGRRGTELHADRESPIRNDHIHLHSRSHRLHRHAGVAEIQQLRELETRRDAQAAGDQAAARGGRGRRREEESHNLFRYADGNS